MRERTTIRRIGNGSGVIGAVWLICLALAPLLSSQNPSYVSRLFEIRYLALAFAVAGALLSSRWWTLLAVLILAIAMIRPV